MLCFTTVKGLGHPDYENTLFKIVPGVASGLMHCTFCITSFVHYVDVENMRQGPSMLFYNV